MKFMIEMTPVGKGRPRVSSRGGYSRMYTPKKTAQFETLFRRQVEKIMKDNDWQMLLDDEPLRVNVCFYFPVPQSISNKKKRELVDKYHIKKPDLDNAIKAVLDACNGIVFPDDSQISVLVSSKRYIHDTESLVGMIALEIDYAE